jgi:hypothetical protein
MSKPKYEEIEREMAEQALIGFKGRKNEIYTLSDLYKSEDSVMYDFTVEYVALFYNGKKKGFKLNFLYLQPLEQFVIKAIKLKDGEECGEDNTQRNFAASMDGDAQFYDNSYEFTELSFHCTRKDDKYHIIASRAVFGMIDGVQIFDFWTDKGTLETIRNVIRDRPSRFNNQYRRPPKDNSDVMSKEHPLWNKFIKELAGPKYIDYTKKKGFVEFRCDTTFKMTKEILESMDGIDIDKSIKYFNDNGAYCDCEILMNIARLGKHKK